VLKPGDKGSFGPVDDLPMLTAASFWVVRTQRQPVGRIAVLGLINHLAGPAALDSFETTTNTITVRLKYAGTLGIIVDAPHKPSATALIDKRPEMVKATQLESLHGHKQGGVFLLTVEVGHAGDGVSGDSGDSDVWDVCISIV
jgi:hypothetical protein